MVSPKQARRRAQLQARERERQRSLKARDRKLSEHAFDGVRERWLSLEPSDEPRYERCPACGKRIMLDVQEGQLSHAHEPRPCAVYDAFARAADQELGLHAGASMEEAISTLVPTRMHGPYTEISEAEGQALLASGDVIESRELRRGMIEGCMIARTASGVFRWSVPREEDDDFDLDDDDDEVSDVSAKRE
jgi:hypothetical protein